MERADSVPPEEALRRLRAGNERFVANIRSVEAMDAQRRRAELVGGQRPFAIVLSCSDSRVPAEIVFDQGLGDLFVIRVAGNVVAPSLVGSVEFAATAFGSRLVVVMGHSSCGAVQATLDSLRGRASAPTDNIRDIVERVRPAVQSVLSAGADRDDDTVLREAVRANVRASANHLRHGSRLLEEMVREGEVSVVEAEYDLETGWVDFFDAAREGSAGAQDPGGRKA